MDTAPPGHPYVKTAIDVACRDILGKSAGLPVCDLLGGREEGAIVADSSIPTGSPGEMADRVAAARARGHRSHSCKVGGTDPAVDVARVAAVTEALETGERVAFDANRAWTPAVAIETMNAAADAAPGWFEQPRETLDQCVRVRRRTRQPIALDEGLHAMGDHIAAHRAGAREGVKVRPNRLGGLTRARQIRDFGIAVGWRMNVEDVGGAAPADTAAVHLAQSTPATHRLGSWLAHERLADDVAPGQGARNRNGETGAPDRPGLGVEPDPDRLGEPVAVYR